MPDTQHPVLITGTVPQGTGESGVSAERSRAELEAKQKELMATLDQWLVGKMADIDAKVAEVMQKSLDGVPTRPEVDAALRGLAQGVGKRFLAQEKDVKEKIDAVLRGVSNQDYVTGDRAKQIAREAVPQTIRNIDAAVVQRTGNQLLLAPGGASGNDSVYFGTVVSGLSAKGDKVLYKGVFLREYDAAGVIVAAGSDINPADYATQALYEAALTAAGHSLKATWDWMRGATDITP
jgi:hypothetical protein